MDLILTFTICFIFLLVVLVFVIRYYIKPKKATNNSKGTRDMNRSTIINRYSDPATSVSIIDTLEVDKNNKEVRIEFRITAKYFDDTDITLVVPTYDHPTNEDMLNAYCEWLRGNSLIDNSYILLPFITSVGVKYTVERFHRNMLDDDNSIIFITNNRKISYDNSKLESIKKYRNSLIKTTKSKINKQF